MGKRKRIGYGALDWGDHRNSQIRLQNEFLKTIEKLEPERKKKPLGDLAAQPFAEYVSYVEKQDEKSSLRRQQILERWEATPGKFSFFPFLDEDDPLRKSIRQWGETHHLNSDWCYDVAFLSLQHWRQFKRRTGKWFETLPYYAHPDYLGFGSQLMVHNMASMPHGSLNEEQKALVDSFTKRQFVESFDEHQRAFLSIYPYDPHTYSDEFFLEQVEQLIEMGTPSVNPVLPVLNLLNTDDRKKLRSTLLKRAKELWERLKQVAEENSSVKPIEVGADEINKHLEWAVKFQVFGEDYYSIEGEKYDYSSGKHKASVNVRKEALRILRLVNLQPRPTTRGRRRAR